MKPRISKGPLKIIIISLITLSTFLYLIHLATTARVNILPSPGTHPTYLPLVRQPVLAFPGAEGFGSTTVGGRGGQVIEVTNLKDAGPGSFRAALQSSGPRIVVFRVGGTIRGKEAFSISKPFITIAGQTAPGDGITLRGAPLVIKTHDVIVRGLRIRVGDQPSVGAEGADGITITASGSTPVYNVIIDHCSVSWAIDENLATYNNVKDITLQWNISSEGLKNSKHPSEIHSMGLLIYDHAKRISVHHNLFAHNNRRNARMSADTETEFINNVVYNWGDLATHLSNDKNADSPSFANIIGNFYKQGADTKPNKGIEIESNMPIGTKIYVQGNIGPGRPNNSSDDWDAVSGGDKYRSLVPVVSESRITTHSAFDTYDLVLSYAGATSPRRDSIDERIVQSVRDGTGRHIDSQRDVGGWLSIDGGTPPQDSDHDGMPDEWELSHGLNPKDAADGTTVAPSGYTYVEEYINELIVMPVNTSR